LQSRLRFFYVAAFPLPPWGCCPYSPSSPFPEMVAADPAGNPIFPAVAAPGAAPGAIFPPRR
jgi:hypothetical protein